MSVHVAWVMFGIFTCASDWGSRCQAFKKVGPILRGQGKRVWPVWCVHGATQGAWSFDFRSFSICSFLPGLRVWEAYFHWPWATDVNNGVPLPTGAAAALRRLHFESEVVLTSTIRASVETPEHGTPKPIPFAEKTARMDDLRARFNGLNIHVVGEPSHTLLDEVHPVWIKGFEIYRTPTMHQQGIGDNNWEVRQKAQVGRKYLGDQRDKECPQRGHLNNVSFVFVLET